MEELVGVNDAKDRVGVSDRRAEPAIAVAIAFSRRTDRSSSALMTSSNSDDDLTDEGVQRLMLEGAAGIIEQKHLVDDWPDLIRFDCAIHLLEHAPIADPDAVQRAFLPHQAVGIDICLASGEHTDQTDLAAPSE